MRRNGSPRSCQIVTWRRVRSILQTYEKARTAGGEATEPYELFCAAITDWLFRVPADRLLEAQSKRQKVFSYRLDWRSPVGEGMLGACHAIDLPFVFGTQQAGPTLGRQGRRRRCPGR